MIEVFIVHSNDGKCPKISYTKVSDKKVYANSADQTGQGLHCLIFH